MPIARRRLTPLAAFASTLLAAVLFAYVIARPRGTISTGADEVASGGIAPDFTLKTLEGTSVSLTSLKGHTIVLDFWATWCPPCVEELPTVTQVAAKYASRGVQFYAVNVSDAPSAIRAFLERHQLKTPILVGGDSDVAEKYAAEYIPLLVVIDADGKLVARDNVSPDEAARTLTQWIEKALKSGQAA